MNLSDGVYVISRQTLIGAGRHFGVMEIEYGKMTAILDFGTKGWSSLQRIEDFSLGRTVQIESTVPHEQYAALPSRLIDIQVNGDQWQFNLFTKNCEHAANYLAHGERKSEQINVLKSVATALLGIVVIVGVFKSA